jgi:hypothetical protein
VVRRIVVLRDLLGRWQLQVNTLVLPRSGPSRLAGLGQRLPYWRRFGAGGEGMT